MAAPIERTAIFSLLSCAKGVIIREKLLAPSTALARTFRLFLPLSRTLGRHGALETEPVGKHHGSVAIRFLSERFEHARRLGQLAACAARISFFKCHLGEIEPCSRRFEHRAAPFECLQRVLICARRFAGTTPITRQASGYALTERHRVGVPGACRHLKATLDEHGGFVAPLVEA